MAFDYPDIRDNTAEPLIKEFGIGGQVAVNDPTTGEPWDSQIGSEVLHSAIFFKSKFTKDNNRGTLVEKNDVLFLMSTEGVTIDPELANRIIVNSVTYQVVRIDPLEPADTIVMWFVHARK